MQSSEVTKERILEAALGEFSNYGVAGARVDRIAHSAGCNKNLIYIYFGNKEKLFTSVLEKNLSRVYEDLPFTPEDLPEFAGRVFDFSMQHPELLRLLAWSTLEQSVELPTGREGSQNAKVTAVSAAQSDGRINAELSPAFIMTTVMALATAWSPAFPFGVAPHADGRTDVRDSIVHTIAMMTGIAAAGGRPPSHEAVQSQAG